MRAARALGFVFSSALIASAARATTEQPDILTRTIRNGAGPRLLSDALEELLDDLASDLSKQPARRLSPLAVRAVRVGPNLNAVEVGRLVEKGLSDRLRRYTRIVAAKCVACTAFTSRVEDGHWVVKRGIASASDMRGLRRDAGIEALADISVQFDNESGKATLVADVVRTDDSRVVFSETYDSDRSRAELLRTGEILKTRAERAADLESMLRGKPAFEVAARFGVMTLPTKRGGEKLTGYGTAIGVKISERFGTNWRHTFGFEADGYFNFNSVAAAVIGVSYWWTMIEPGLFAPDWRLGGGVAAVVIGTEGNTALFSFGVEARLKRRFSISTEAIYTVERKLDSVRIGGLGVRTRFGVNW